MTQAATLTLRQDEATNTISVYRENVAEPILTQNTKPDMRPYLHPIVPPDGKGMLTEYSPGHHPHQTGLYWGFTRVNGRDYFHNPSNGYWRRISSKPVVAKGESVKWSTVYHLLDAAGKPIMAETQVWTMRDSGDRYLLDLEWTGEGLVDITVGKYDYGGLFLRMPWRDGMEGAAFNSNESLLFLLAFGKQASPQSCRAITGDWTIAKGKSETIRHQFLVYCGEFKEGAIKEAWEKYSGKSIGAALTQPTK